MKCLLYFITLIMLTTHSAVSLAERKTVSLPTMKADQFALYNQGHYQIFSLLEVDGLKLDESCKSKLKPTCAAYQVGINGKVNHQVNHKNGEFNGSPASQFCSDLGGANLIALNSQKQEFNFCEFKDGSLVNSWSLYYKRNPKNVIQ